MQIQVNTDNHIQGDARLIEYVEGIVTDALDRFGDRITRVEVHLTDQNSRNKAGGNDKRCVLEARLSHKQPVSVSHDADTVKESLHGAADKMEKLLDHTIGKLSNHKGNTSFAGDQDPIDDSDEDDGDDDDE